MEETGVRSVLKPSRFCADPSDPSASKVFRHWYKTFENFVNYGANGNLDRLSLLVNYVSAEVFELIEDAQTYEEAVKTLKDTFLKPPNEIFARHLLATRVQGTGESIDNFLLDLKRLSRDCDFKAVTANEHRDEMVRDAFINGLSSSFIRQRLLEHRSLSLSTTISQAHILDRAQKESSGYALPVTAVAASPTGETTDFDTDATAAAVPKPASSSTSGPRKPCFFCGKAYHDRKLCPARDQYCHKCCKKGHFSSVCRSSIVASTLATVLPSGLKSATIPVIIAGQQFTALIDTGSSDSFISEEIARKLNIRTSESFRKITMATKTLTIQCLGQCDIDIKIEDCCYKNSRLGIIPNLCTDIILGQDFQRQHSRLIFEYGGPLADLKIPSNHSHCAVSAASIDSPRLFRNLLPGCKPVAVKSRRFCKEDKDFIGEEISKLLHDGVVEPSTSPWRAQIVVVKDATQRHKRRLCIDYSQTVNLFTELDAYPLPRIEDIVNDLANYSVFSTFDLKSAYHQVPIHNSEKKYTAFEANGKLYQYTRVPFGVTNGVAVFQREMDKLIKNAELKDTFAYLDNITVAGHTQQEHDENVRKLLTTLHEKEMTLNDSKTVSSVPKISILGYTVGNGTIQPDQERLKPLRELPLPSSGAALRRALGMFAYYAKWIPNFSERVRPLMKAKSFPLNEKEASVFRSLKLELEKATLKSIDEHTPFVVECDASDSTISATLNQGGRPVAFMSRTLQGSEKHYPAVEKEATAIIEAVRRWCHLLSRRHFTIITDQRSVAFMFDSRKRTKVKNSKIQGWRLELSAFSYTSRYRPGKDNVAADALSRAYCASLSLSDVHEKLCHPGVTRLLHFVRSRNLPFSTEDVRKTCSSCKVCAQLKPNFVKFHSQKLVKATKPLERLSIDFKGPIAARSKNPYMLTIVDEYSRFPFAFAVPNTNAHTVIKCMDSIISLCGMPGYVHSDRGSAFISREFKEYLLGKGIASSNSSPYHPTGNSQVERFNGTIFKAVQLALTSKGLPIEQWEAVLPEALHSVRSLLCTSTNETPHERFFSFPRKSTYGKSLPSWLRPGPVMLRRFVRANNASPLVDEVELLDANPTYAHVRYPDGRESTVSINDLSPSPEGKHSGEEPLPLVTDAVSHPGLHHGIQTEHAPEMSIHSSPHADQPSLESPSVRQSGTTLVPPPLRRSSRISKPPERLSYEHP